MMQNSDEELIALCQQLSGEISARTSASLEIIRLKEGRSIERTHEASEKEALKDELKRVKERLALEQSKAEDQKQKLSYAAIVRRNYSGQRVEGKQTIVLVSRTLTRSCESTTTTSYGRSVLHYFVATNPS
jgi:hypothetical protein